MSTPERSARANRVAASRQQGAVVLEDVHDPHNASAVFRSCDAFGVQLAHLIFVNETRYNPRKIGKQSSSSASKWLDFTLHSSTEACLAQLHDEGYETIATVPRDADETIFQATFDNPKTAFLFGNEHRGLSETAVRLARRRIAIPMAGMVDSLNISVTAAICLFELTRQRSARGDGRHRLTESRIAGLAEDFLARGRRQTAT